MLNWEIFMDKMDMLEKELSRKRNKKILMIGAPVLLVLLIAGSIWYFAKSPDSGLFAGKTEDGIKYQISETVNLPMEKIRTLNPVTSMDQDVYHMSKLVYQSLFTLDETLTPTPQLVNMYSYDNSNVSMDITLNRDAYFSGGRNLKAADVKYSIEQYKAAAASGSTVYGGYVAHIKSVKLDKEDDYKLTIFFDSKVNMGEEQLIFPVVTESTYGKYDAYKVKSGKFIPEGSGPYMVEKYNDIAGLTMVANPNYRGEKPKNTLNFVILPSRDDLVSLLDVGKINFGISTEISRDADIADKDIVDRSFPLNQVEVIGFNFNKPYMKAKRVRKAVAYALDCADINDSVYYKKGILSDTILYPGYMGLENKGDIYPMNLDKAEKLLLDYGFKHKDGDGPMVDKEDEPLVLRILVDGTAKERMVIFEELQESLTYLKVGCQLIQAQGTEEFKQMVYAGDYDMFIGGLTINETYDLRPLLATGYGNPLGYSNPNLDKLMDRIKSGISQEKKREALEEIRNILADEIPYYTILYKSGGGLVASSLMDYQDTTLFDYYFRGVEKWRCRYAVSLYKED